MKLLGGILIGAAASALAVWYIGRTHGALVPQSLSELNPLAANGPLTVQGGRWSTGGASGCHARAYTSASIAAPGSWGG